MSKIKVLFKLLLIQVFFLSGRIVTLLTHNAFDLPIHKDDISYINKAV